MPDRALPRRVLSQLRAAALDPSSPLTHRERVRVLSRTGRLLARPVRVIVLPDGTRRALRPNAHPTREAA